jgi:hypothetical protein
MTNQAEHQNQPLFEYLLGGSVNHIWLDNFLAVYKRDDIDGMDVVLEWSARSDPPLYLRLYEAACLHQPSHDHFYTLARASLQLCLKSVLVVCQVLISTGQFKAGAEQLLYDALAAALDSMDAEAEREGVKLATLLLQQRNDVYVIRLFKGVIDNRPDRPSPLDFRRLCFLQQVSVESGWFVEEMAPFVDKLPRRSKYRDYKVEAGCCASLGEIVEEIPLYRGRHVCAHECYHD